MPAPFPNPREGKPVARHPSGFPLFYDGHRRPRIVTADPWALMRRLVARRLLRRSRRGALAFIDQAFELYEAATNPHLRSKPLLYYYSFLNLAKAALLLRGVPLPPVVNHGIKDPGANARKRLRLAGQRVLMFSRSAKHDQVFSEFVALLGGDSSQKREFRVVDLLGQMPSIHRCFCEIAETTCRFAPISSMQVLRGGREIWARITLKKTDADVATSFPDLQRKAAFRTVMRQVAAQKPDEIWLETGAVDAPTNRTDWAIGQLAETLRTVGMWPILTGRGYLYYLAAVESKKILPSLASLYAVMFYLGSVTRYKPHDFDSMAGEARYGWLISEFVAIQPAQFLYGLASVLAGVDVVRPYALLD